MIHDAFFYSPRAQTDVFVVFMIYGGVIPTFSPFVYTTAALSLLVLPFLRIWWTRYASALTGKGCLLVRASC